LEEALSGSLKNWEETARGKLALIILLDQLTRNAFRNTARMCDGDEEALRLSDRLIKSGGDKGFLCIERLFLYMPLMHAEDLSMQELSVENFKVLSKDIMDVNPANEKYYRDQLGYAQKYFSIIERFGRFPHRNNVLERVSTDQELEFLNMSQSS
jgi:uncharacterized protein (DUF924 family)